MTTQSSKPFVVVLAGGEGTRLAPLTRALYGHDLPKQFAVLAGDRSLLQHTIERALLLTPAERVLIVVTAHREAIARDQIAPYPGVQLVVQPRNLDTGPGLLLPLARLLAHGGATRVVFLPSDHFVADNGPLTAAVRASERGAVNERVSLVGVSPTGPEVEYGWIVRGRRVGRSRAFSVARFAEKPDAQDAEELWRGGALWNTFISAAPVRVLWDLARQHLPQHTQALEPYSAAIGTAHEHAALDHAYAAMQPANFSRDVLSHAKNLAVVPVAGSGWSDWGSPKRVFASLHGTPNHERLVARIRGDMQVALAG